MSGAYYNEIDPYAAQWLRNLIAAGHITPGDVDERSIVDVRADDLRGYRQCHFFAGVGVWSYALRLAGWPDDREVWTGSCPCQPFSAAGRAGGFGDGRHLWPHWSGLIGERRPGVVFGEQVASADGLAWLDFVCADLEGAGYAVGALDLCAAGFGAPHIRQRLFFVADDTEQRRGAQPQWNGREDGRAAAQPGRLRDACELADAAGERAGFCGTSEQGSDGTEVGISRENCEAGELAYPDGRDAGTEGLQRGREYGLEPKDGGAGELVGNAVIERREGCGTGLRSEPGHGGGGEPAPTAGFWRDCDWLPCIDGKARPVEPGTFPLAHGAPARVGRLRAYGNAIVAPVAAEFIAAYMSVFGDHGGVK
jgi:DNA (cytosine-5)-methyltransferase 1